MWDFVTRQVHVHGTPHSVALCDTSVRGLLRVPTLYSFDRFWQSSCSEISSNCKCTTRSLRAITMHYVAYGLGPI